MLSADGKHRYKQRKSRPGFYLVKIKEHGKEDNKEEGEKGGGILSSAGKSNGKRIAEKTKRTGKNIQQRVQLQSEPRSYPGRNSQSKARNYLALLSAAGNKQPLVGDVTQLPEKVNVLTTLCVLKKHPAYLVCKGKNESGETVEYSVEEKQK